MTLAGLHSEGEGTHYSERRGGETEQTGGRFSEQGWILFVIRLLNASLSQVASAGAERSRLVQEVALLKEGQAKALAEAQTRAREIEMKNREIGMLNRNLKEK